MINQPGDDASLSENNSSDSELWSALGLTIEDREAMKRRKQKNEEGLETDEESITEDLSDKIKQISSIEKVI